MAVLLIPFTTDYTNDTTLSSITEIRFTGQFDATATFAASQLDGNPISTSVVILGNLSVNGIVVRGGSVDASGWAFAHWNEIRPDAITLVAALTGSTITGTIQNDTIAGLFGADTLRGGLGVDRLTGGGFGDAFDYGTPAEIVSGESLDGGSGGDRIRLADIAGIYDFRGATVVNVETAELIGRSSLSLASNHIGAGVGRIATVTGGSGVNELRVSGALTDLTGVALTGIERVVLSGTNGQDIAIGSAQADLLIDSLGADQLSGAGGADTIDGRALAGGAGGDGFDGGGGFDRLALNLVPFIDYDFTGAAISGIEALTTLASGFTAAARFLPSQLGGAAGIGLIENKFAALTLKVAGNAIDLSGLAYAFNAAGVAFQLSGTAAADHILGSSRNDTAGGGAGGDMIVGGLGSDRLDGGGEADTLSGDGGADNITGGLGNDRIDGGNENDLLSGGTGNDLIGGGGGNDVISGNEDNDTLSGDAGNDTLTGGAGIDRLQGGDGNDTLDGGAGNDNLTGGAGFDTYKFEAAAGSEAVFGFEDNVGTLRIDPSYGFANAAAVVAATISTQGHARIILGGGNQIYLMNYTANGGSVANLADDILIA